MNTVKKRLAEYLLHFVIVSSMFIGCYRLPILKQTPRTYSDAVEYILSEMTEKQKDELRNTTKYDLIDYHMTVGRYIRNEFGLWNDNRALLHSCAVRVDLINLHPDDASMIIIEGVWESLNQTNQ